MRPARAVRRPASPRDAGGLGRVSPYEYSLRANTPFRGAVLPTFTTRGGDEVPVPEAYQAALKAAVEGASCVGCRHSHYLQARLSKQQQITVDSNGE